METLELIQQLYHKDSGIRRQAVLVIGMVEETAALMALQQRMREETDDAIRHIVKWAGTRVQSAENKGFSTIDAIFDHFKIDREIQSGIDPEEAELLRHQTDVTTNSSSGGMFSDIRLGSTLTADNIQTGRLGNRGSDKKSLLRQPAVQPSDMDIKIKIKQLMDASNPRSQKNAALSLRDINNPMALPYLGLVFFRNENPDIRDVIEKAGKVLYWNTNYYAMENNGRLNLEIARRRREGGFDRRPIETNKQPQTEAQDSPSQPSVTDILSQAQRNRKKRKR